MPRLPRVVIPELPHHVTQRGNRGQKTFFADADYERYIDCLTQTCSLAGVEIWAYALLPTHVHLIAVPMSKDALTRGIGSGHELYTRYLNARKGWRGHLWQGRFSSFPMDETQLLNAARYIELAPVTAGLVSKPEEYPWSSARSHLGAEKDTFVRSLALSQRVPDWKAFLAQGVDEKQAALIEKHERTGRPLGNPKFVARLEEKTGLTLVPQKPGPKPRRIFEDT